MMMIVVPPACTPPLRPHSQVMFTGVFLLTRCAAPPAEKSGLIAAEAKLTAFQKEDFEFDLRGESVGGDGERIGVGATEGEEAAAEAARKDARVAVSPRKPLPPPVRTQLAGGPAVEQPDEQPLTPPPVGLGLEDGGEEEESGLLGAWAVDSSRAAAAGEGGHGRRCVGVDSRTLTWLFFPSSISPRLRPYTIQTPPIQSNHPRSHHSSTFRADRSRQLRHVVSSFKRQMRHDFNLDEATAARLLLGLGDESMPAMSLFGPPMINLGAGGAPAPQQQSSAGRVRARSATFSRKAGAFGLELGGDAGAGTSSSGSEGIKAFRVESAAGGGAAGVRAAAEMQQQEPLPAHHLLKGSVGSGINPLGNAISVKPAETGSRVSWLHVLPQMKGIRGAFLTQACLYSDTSPLICTRPLHIPTPPTQPPALVAVCRLCRQRPANRPQHPECPVHGAACHHPAAEAVRSPNWQRQRLQSSGRCL